MIAAVSLTVLSIGFMHLNDRTKCMEYICDSLFAELEEAMYAPKEAFERNSAKVGAGTVADELKTFGEKCKCLSA